MTPNKEVPSGRRLSAEISARLQHLAVTQPWLFVLPRAYRAEFAVRRQEQFARLTIVGTPLLLLMYFSITFAGYLIFSFEIDGVDKSLWWALTGVDGALVLTGLLLARIPRLLPYYPAWVGVIGCLLLANKLYLSLAVTSMRLAQHETYVCMLIITVVMLALRLRLAVSLAACTGAGVLALGLAHQHGFPADIPQLLFYFIGSVIVNGFVAWLLERQERLNFLQAVLIEHEAAERAQLNQQLLRIARQDPLSGLSNRRHFDESLAEEWDRARRDKQELALLFIDVDHFKNFNDTYGHPAGDSCLSALGAILGEALRRPADMAARFGGEEFVILLPNTGLRGAREVAERVMAAVDALAMPHKSSTAAPHVTVSIGLASARPSEGPLLAQSLVDDADAALYEAKRLGRHRIATQPQPGARAAGSKTPQHHQ